MRTSKPRILTLLAVIALVSVDCGWLRHLFGWRGSALGLGTGAEDGVLDLGVFALLNVLGVSSLASRDHKQPFLVGFGAAGVTAIAAYLACFWLFPQALGRDVVQMGIIQRIHNAFMRHLPTWAPAFNRNEIYPTSILVPLVLLYTVALVLPLLLVAFIGGLVSRHVGQRA